MQSSHLVAILSLLTLCWLAPVSRATIVLKDITKKEFGFTPVFRSAAVDGTKTLQVERLGVATYAGVSYVAGRSTGSGIVVAPRDPGAKEYSPSIDPKLTYLFDKNDPVHVAALIPRGDLLYLVAYSLAQDRVFVQALRQKPQSTQLVSAEPAVIIPCPRSDSPLKGVAAIGTDEAIYVHFLLGGAYPSLITVRVTGKDRKVEMGALTVSRSDLPSKPEACDGAVISEPTVDGQGAEPVQYITWATTSGYIYVARFRPNNPRATSYRQTALRSLVGFPPTLTLLDSGMESDIPGSRPAELYLTLILLLVDDDGEPHWKTATFTPSTQTFSSFESLLFPNNKYKPQTCLHWGVDKTAVRGINREKFGQISFYRELRQNFRMVSLGTIYPRFVLPEAWCCSATADGNRLVADEALPKSNQGVTTVDTGERIAAVDPATRSDMLGAWTLLGVISGPPPYIPFHQGERYPDVRLSWRSSEAKTTGLSVAEETEYSVLGSINVGGSDAVTKGLYGGFSLSYGYSTKDVTTQINSTTQITSTETATIFSPRPTKDAPDASAVGYLIYYVPKIVSRTYLVRPPEGRFTAGAARRVTLSGIGGNTIKTYEYLIDRPDLGPLETMRDNAPNPLLELTAGMAPFPPTTQFNKWDDDPTEGKSGDKDYATFPVLGAKPTVKASASQGGEVTMDHETRNADETISASSKSSTLGLSLSVGFKGIFEIKAEGKAAFAKATTTSTKVETSIGRAVTISYPPLWKAGEKGQPVRAIEVVPELIYSSNAAAPRWTPTAMKASSSPFLLTWRVESVEPRVYLRKPWKMSRPDYLTPQRLLWTEDGW